MLCHLLCHCRSKYDVDEVIWQHETIAHRRDHNNAYGNLIRQDMADCDAHAANAHSTLNQHTTKIRHVGDTNHDADTED